MFLFIVLVLLSSSFQYSSNENIVVSAKKRASAQKWDKMFADKDSIKKLEEDLMVGDEEEELQTEGHMEYLNMERRKKNAPRRPLY